MGLIGGLFYAITYPGALINGIIQVVFSERYNVPTERLAIPEGLDDETIEEDPEAVQQIRPLGPEEEPGPDESVSFVVDYEQIDSYSNLFWLVLGPFFVTSLLALVLFGAHVSAEMGGIITGDWLWLLLFYPGFAVGAHAFPNSEPTDALLRGSKQTSSHLRVIGYPLVAISKVMSVLRVLWADALYSLFLYLLLAIPLGVI